MKMKSAFNIFSLLLISFSAIAQMPQPGKRPVRVSGSSLKRTVACREFNKDGENGRTYSKPVKADTLTVLPKNFPTAPYGATTCGCYKEDFAAYYLTPQKPMEIFDYYSKKLQLQGYIVGGIEGTSNPDDFQLRFKNHDGQGYIYAYGDKYAYKIFYEAVGRSCNCPGKR